jgi:hypothetical protein
MFLSNREFPSSTAWPKSGLFVEVEQAIVY